VRECLIPQALHSTGLLSGPLRHWGELSAPQWQHGPPTSWRHLLRDARTFLVRVAAWWFGCGGGGVTTCWGVMGQLAAAARGLAGWLLAKLDGCGACWSVG